MPEGTASDPPVVPWSLIRRLDNARAVERRGRMASSWEASMVAEYDESGVIVSRQFLVLGAYRGGSRNGTHWILVFSRWSESR
jgi:hypothetical protein